LTYVHLTRKGAVVASGSYLPLNLDGYTAGLMGVFGYRTKWSGFTMYFDGGIGWQYTLVEGGQNSGGITGSGLLYELNIGIGLPF
jgi:hypothetical protein